MAQLGLCKRAYAIHQMICFTAIVPRANYEKFSLPIVFPLENVRSRAAFKLLHDISMEIIMTADTISVQVMCVIMVA